MCGSSRPITQSAPPRNRFLFSFALYFLHHNSQCRVAGEQPTGVYFETSHPKPRSDQTTLLACSTQQSLETCRYIIGGMDWHKHPPAGVRAPQDANSQTQHLQPRVVPCIAPQAHRGRRDLQGWLQAPAARRAACQSRSSAVSQSKWEFLQARCHGWKAKPSSTSLCSLDVPWPEVTLCVISSIRVVRSNANHL